MSHRFVRSIPPSSDLTLIVIVSCNQAKKQKKEKAEPKKEQAEEAEVEPEQEEEGDPKVGFDYGDEIENILGIQKSKEGFLVAYVSWCVMSPPPVRRPRWSRG